MVRVDIISLINGKKILLTNIKWLSSLEMRILESYDRPNLRNIQSQTVDKTQSIIGVYVNIYLFEMNQCGLKIRNYQFEIDINYFYNKNGS